MYFTINAILKIFYMNINLFIFITFLNIVKNYIVLPIKTNKISSDNTRIKEENEIELILSIINSDIIYSSISFGTPDSSIDFYFSMEQYPTSINQNICFKDSLSSYNQLNSQSFQKIKNDLFSEKCSFFKDLNLTENITINSFFFYLNKDNSENDFIDNFNGLKYLKERNKYCGIIGLSRYPYNSDLNFNSFIYNLKNKNYINSFSFGFFFFNDKKEKNVEGENEDIYDGFLIAGITYDDNIDIFDTNLQCTIYAEEGSLNWAINFERIFYYQKINETVEYISTNNTKVEFIIDLNYIISDEQYYEDIKKYYFQKFFENNTCYEEKSVINGKFIYMITCNLNFKENMKKFPEIYFYSEQLFFAFNLNEEDLFYQYNDKIYFLIVRKEEVINYWKIGKIFLKKYPLIFDYDKKIVSYVYLKKEWNPTKKVKNKEHLINTNNDKDNNFNKGYSIYIFLIIGIIIGIFIGRRIWNKNKKLKANELEEKYKYFDSENKSNK